MELAGAASHASCSFPVRAPVVTSKGFSASLAFIGNRAQNHCLFSNKPKGCANLVNPVKRQCSYLAAVIGDKSAVPYDYSKKQLLPSDSSVSSSIDDGLKQNEKREEKDLDESELNITCDELDESEMSIKCDMLIEVFMVKHPTPAEWRKLLTVSRRWDKVRPHFYKRCQERADNEDDPGKKYQFHRLVRKLKEIDEDVQRHNELIEVMKRASSEIEISEIVRWRHQEFTKEFFEHLHNVAVSHETEREILHQLVRKFKPAIEAYLRASSSIEAINAAESKLKDILDSPTVDAACRKIDDLATKNQLDPALMMMISKAWSDAKESNMMVDEAKDMLHHMYMTAVGNFQRLMPKDVRIMKYLLTIEDREELLSNLKDAFTPGEELEGETVDTLCTTPDKLHTQIKTVLDGYHSNREDALIAEVKDLLSPMTIVRLEKLKKLIEEQFL